jgi:predicted MPP superfamily phosphohydrolase
VIHASPGWAAERLEMENSRHWISPVGRRTRWRHRLSSRLLALANRALSVTPVHRRGLRNALDPRLVELEICFADLPAGFDGYRILHLSDTHLDVLPQLAETARALLNGLEVDLLALTGDVHGEHGAPLEQSAGLLAQALEGLSVSGPRVAILGNHDPAAMAPLLDAMGFEVLVNRSLVLFRRDDRVRLTGLDDVHSFYTEAARRALADHEGEFRIALVHSGELADHAAATGHALYLCGHTHGGQVCLPGGRLVISNLKRCRFAARGLWRHAGMAGYTNSGLGVGPPPLRFNCHGEAALITLRCR